MGDLRWMLFVDGENFTIQGQRVAAAAGIELEEGPFYCPDVLLWPKGLPARRAFTSNILWRHAHELGANAVRAYYYTSAVGGTQVTGELTRRIHRIGFDAQVFKRNRNTKRSKAVDISLAVDMLHHAQADHYDVAVLLAGDGDYIPLIRAVKRLGKLVWVGFFDAPTHPDMFVVPDWYTTMDDWLLRAWRPGKR